MIWYILALSCVIPTILSIIYYKRIATSYYPFVYTIWLAVIAEIIAVIGEVKDLNYLKPISYNIFLFINFALFLRFFTLQRIYTVKRAIIIFSIVSIINIIELIVKPSSSFINITSSLESAFIIIGCVQIISQLIFDVKTFLLSNFLFIVAAATIFASLFDIYTTFLMYLININESTKQQIAVVYKITNAAYYLIVTYALTCLAWTKK